jgi:hypothetical protein
MKLADRYNANITECNQLEQPQRKLIDELPVGKLLAKRFKVKDSYKVALDRFHDGDKEDQAQYSAGGENRQGNDQIR